MTTTVTMPILGLTMKEGTVAAWHKHEGETVSEDEALLSVEMDKGVQEVPAPCAGTVRHILVPEGQTVPVQTALAEIDSGELPRTEPQVTSFLARGGPGWGEAPPNGRDLTSFRPIQERAQRGGGGDNGIAVLHASPLARATARKLGVDLRKIAGSGPHGRVVQRDVLSAAPVHEVVHPVAPKSTTAAAPSAPVVPEVEPLGRLRRLTAERMALSARSIPRVTEFAQVDLAEADELRRRLAPELALVGVPKLPWDVLLAKAIGLALVEHPRVHATWVEGQGLLRHQDAHVGIAVALEPEGLIVPVLRHADTRSLRELASELLSLAARARAGTLTPADLEDGTFTLTNLGQTRVEAFTPLINPPQSGILGIGRIAPGPVVVDGELRVRLQATLALTFDHRVVDGAPAAAFLTRVVDLLEHPYALVAR